MSLNGETRDELLFLSSGEGCLLSVITINLLNFGGVQVI